MTDVKLLVVDVLVGAGGGVPHGGELFGHVLGEGADAASALAVGWAGLGLLGGILGGEGIVDGARLDEELVLGMIEGRLAQTIVGMEEDLLIPLD